jgi:hypothetical protein
MEKILGNQSDDFMTMLSKGAGPVEEAKNIKGYDEILKMDNIIDLIDNVTNLFDFTKSDFKETINSVNTIDVDFSLLNDLMTNKVKNPFPKFSNFQISINSQYFKQFDT